MYGVKVTRLPEPEEKAEEELDNGMAPLARVDGEGIAEGEPPDLDDSVGL